MMQALRHQAASRSLALHLLLGAGLRCCGQENCLHQITDFRQLLAKFHDIRLIGSPTATLYMCFGVALLIQSLLFFLLHQPL